MKYIGLLMICDEDDILADVLRGHGKITDAIYVLDGSDPNGVSAALCQEYAGYFTDREVPESYPVHPTDGYRQFIYEKARAEHGPGNWFLELHGDEVWTFDPRAVVAEHPGADGFIFRLPFFFPHIDEGWDVARSPLEQLHYRLGPGWPEFRMFRGGTNVGFDPAQHFDTQPSGLRNVVRSEREILHYPFRAPDDQRARAARHALTGFDPDNYQHILSDDRVLWDEDLIHRYRSNQHFAEMTA